MTIPSLSETTIRQHASSQSFYKGEDYCQEGAVTALIQRGDTLQADVEGSQYTPYRVTVHFDGGGITSADCTCPYDHGGWCKHIVAALLTCLREPQRLEQRPSLQTLLSGVDREQLQALLRQLAQASPELADRIETELLMLQATAAPAATATTPAVRHTAVDPQPFRRQIRAALHSLERTRYSEAYGQMASVVEGMGRLLDQASEFLEAGDARNALVILEAITDEYVKGWYQVNDYDGDLPSFFDELGSVWTEALLTADLSAQERQEWRRKLTAWQTESSAYGVDNAFEAACYVARTGWEEPQLQRVLQGEITEKGAWEGEPPDFADDLAVARLRVLERQQRYQEYLYLAEAEGQLDLYAMQLARLGRTAEAEAAGLQYLTQPNELLELAKVLRERGELAAARRMAEHGLSLDGFKAGLADWLCELAAGMGDTAGALNAAMIACQEAPSLNAYQRVRELAGADWPAQQAVLLEQLRRSKTFDDSGKVEIFLHEGRIDDAIATVAGPYPNRRILAPVMDAAITQRPDWVIQGACREAESIMNGGQAAYYDEAVEWLRKAKAAYQAAGREQEWRAYLRELLSRHQRKYKLRPMLEQLGK